MIIKANHMKTRLFTISLLATLTVSCSIQEVDQNSEYYPTDQVFYAKMEVPAGDVETKVYVDDDLMVLWHADDRVSIFNKYTFNQEYRFTGKTGDNSGAFKKVESDDFITGNVLDNVYAIYPYQESTEVSNQGVLTVTLPATQTYVKDSFGPGANTMVSCSENNELIFKNLCGYVMLKLYGDNVAVKSISIKGNNDEPLAGTATVNAAVDAPPTLKFASNASKEITLTFDSPVTIGSTEKTATTFWLVVPPTTFSKGFTLTVKDSKNWGFEKTTSSSFKVERNSLARMAALEVVPEEPDASEEPIVFADQGIKEALIAKFDTNGDGELSYKEAAAVTSIEGVFGTKKSFTSFDEFQYFSGVTLIPNSQFADWVLLSSIILPESVEKIGDRAFYRCENLQSVVMGNSVKSINISAFYECKKLMSIKIPDSVQTLGSCVFRGCTSLRLANLPDGIETINAELFYGCKLLTNISIPETVETIKACAFLGCEQITEMRLPNSIELIEYDSFADCKGLKYVVLPNSLERLEKEVFLGCESLEKITIPESVKSFGNGVFYGCASLSSITDLAETPPYGQSDMFTGTNIQSIFVPAESVDAYKSAEYWSEYADRIQAIGTPMAVDLGLPSGLKWASFNLGAMAPEECGDYYAWGETEPYYSSQNPLTWKDGKSSGYDWASYRWCNGSYNTLTKYNTSSDYGAVDNKTVLDAEDDAAHFKYGGKWRTPTDEEWGELIDECTWAWTDNYNDSGVAGELVTGSTGNSIFLPAAGYRKGLYRYFSNSGGHYWSSQLDTQDLVDAWYVFFNFDGVARVNGHYRYYGRQVRPVSD